MRRWRVWAAIRSTLAPAAAAAVARARRGAARRLSMRAIPFPRKGLGDSGGAMAGRARPRMLVNSGPGWCHERARRRAGDRVGGRVVAVGDADDLAGGAGVGFGAADVDQQTLGPGLEVGEGEGGQLGAPQRGGVAEQNDRGVAGSPRGGAVDRDYDLPDLGGVQRPGRAARREPEEAAQLAADLSDGLVSDRVGQTAAAVLVADGRAGNLDGAVGQAGGSALVR